MDTEDTLDSLHDEMSGQFTDESAATEPVISQQNFFSSTNKVLRFKTDSQESSSTSVVLQKHKLPTFTLVIVLLYLWSVTLHCVYQRSERDVDLSAVETKVWG